MINIEIEKDDLEKMKQHIQVSVDYLSKAPLSVKHVFAKDIIDGKRLIDSINEYQKMEG